MKEKPIILWKKVHHQRHEDIFYESAEPKPESEDESSNRDRVSNQPSLKESTSKFIEVADDEFFDAEEPTSWERGEDPELKFYEELEGSSMDEVEQKAHNLPVWSA